MSKKKNGQLRRKKEPNLLKSKSRVSIYYEIVIKGMMRNQFESLFTCFYFPYSFKMMSDNL